MSKLRSLNTVIWSDTWFEVLNPEEKLLFIYFVTNEKTNMLGVYEISLRKVSFETGIDVSKIGEYLKKFEADGKIRYASNRVLLLNFLKHQNYNFNMMKSAIRTYNDLPIELKGSITIVLEETKEGFETLCNGFAGVRKYEYEYEYEYEKELEKEVEEKNIYDFELLNTSEFKDVRELQKYYLNNLRLMNALSDEPKNKIKFKDISKRLEDFTKELESSGRFKETFKEYSGYFKNWIRTVPKKSEAKKDSQGRMVANFSNPVI